MEYSDQTLHKLLRQRADECPTRTFIRFEGRKQSLEKINRWSDAFAARLLSIGFKKYGKVAILARNCPAYVAAYFGILRAGGVVVPLNIMLAPDEIKYILKDSDSAFCFFGAESSDTANRLSDLNETVFIDINSILPDDNAAAYELPEAGTNTEDVSTILYTSGTTGYPKGAMLTHSNLLSNATAATKALDVFPSDRFVVFLPLSHAFTFTVCVLLPLYVGASITLIPSVSPFAKVVKRMILDRVNIFIAVPSVYDILARKKLPFYIKLLLRFRLCISGASALSSSTLELFQKKFRAPLLQGYGLTEASPIVCVNRLGPNGHKPGTVGKPLDSVELRVVDDESNPLPPNTAGELIVRGPSIMKGYYKREADTAQTIKDGWLYTGDVAVIDCEGFVQIVDRKKDLIIVDGLNIYPSEVENAAQRHPEVAACAMVGIDTEGRELPVMFVMAEKESRLNELELKKFLRGKIAAFKMPKKIIFVNDLPKTLTGKVLKRELKKWKVN